MPTCDVDYGTASFKGIEFIIKPTTNTIGRRISVNLYPFTDNHYNEDLGDQPERWSVSGVFVGEDARDRLQVAKRLWRTSSDGVFFEPTENRRHDVKMISATFEYDDQRINYIPFTLELIERANDPYPGLAGGLLGGINGIIDDFINTVSGAYAAVISEVGAFNDVVSGFGAANDFLFDTTRQTVTGSGFPDVIDAVNNAEPSSNPVTTAATVESVFEIAAAADAPLSFFMQSSEVRVAGNDTEQAQGDLFALTALAYYFEAAVEGGVTYTDLRDFRERALALKSQAFNQDVASAIDNLILEIGRSAAYIECKTYTGTHNALVASYELYGDVSRARDIMCRSGGVSGAAMSNVVYV